MSDVTVVIPVERGREWPRDRATNLPYGTPILEVQYDEGEWAQAVNDGVAAAKTEYVILSHPNAWFERNPEAVDFLTDLCQDSDVTYGPLVVHRDGKPFAVAGEGVFCPNRLRNENYINAVSCVRKEAFQKVGGVQTGPWDLYVRLSEAGGRFKYVPEAVTARDDQWEDPSPTPTRTDVKASFYHQGTPGTTYWRCTLPARHLPGQVLFNMPGRVEDESGRLKLTNHRGTAVFQYVGDQNHLLLTKHMQSEGTRVLIEVDDDYTHWHKTQMKNAGWHEKVSDPPYRLPNGGMSPGGAIGYSVECHRENARIADGITVTTEHLAKMYRELNDNVFVCPNQVDPIDWPERAEDDGIFRVGWFASGSHRGDGELVKRAMEWASRQKDVRVVTIGCGATGGKPWYSFPYEHRPWSNDLNVYKRFMVDLDLGLCPVVGTPWAQSRSDLKALEYGVAGAYPIVSDQPPYNTVDLPKAKTPKDWLKLVQHAVQNRDETKQLAKEWREYVLEKRTVKGNIDRWQEAIHQE